MDRLVPSGILLQRRSLAPPGKSIDTAGKEGGAVLCDLRHAHRTPPREETLLRLLKGRQVASGGNRRRRRAEDVRRMQHIRSEKHPPLESPLPDVGEEHQQIRQRGDDSFLPYGLEAFRLVLVPQHLANGLEQVRTHKRNGRLARLAG